ncbi:MAG TPA: BTAD domain-containing putative transcriptional regulator [Ktedonobacterales bacterium]
MSATRLIGVGTLPAWKFQPPRLAAPLLPRPRLTEQLDQWLGRIPNPASVVLVTAPAGYGKSAALGQWAECSGVGHAWYHADTSDDDPAVLLSGLIQTLRKRLPRGEWTAARLLRRAGSGALSPTDARRIATVLASDIAANVKRPLALIVTGVTATTGGGASVGVLSALVNRAPDGLRLVLETREPPPLRLAHLLTQQRVRGLDSDELLLRDDELPALLQLLGVPADEQYIELLRTLCGGWITGVLLASGAILPSFLAAGAVDAIDAQRVFEYLSAEVIDRLPAPLAEFATEAAVLGYMTAPLCANLLELVDAREELASLDRHLGFLTRVGRRPQEPVYRFQPLLRRALLERLSSGHRGPERRRELHERAGLLFETIGDGEEALRQHIAAGRLDRAVAVIEAHRDLLLREGRGVTLARWVELLPPEECTRHPHLHALLAELRRQSGRLDEAWDTVEQACALILPQAGAEPVAAARALHTRALILYARGHYADARADCERALRLVPPEQDELRSRVTLALVPCVAALEGPARALALLEAAEPECARLGDPWILARMHYQRSHQLMAQGDYLRAEPAASAALHCAQEANAELDAVNARFNLGAIAMHLERFTQAHEHFEVAAAQAEACGYRLGTAYALLNLGTLEIETGLLSRAEESFRRAERMAREMGDMPLLASVIVGQGYALTLSGRAAEAREMLDAALRDAAYAAACDQRIWLDIALGFALLRQGEPERAVAALEEAGSLAAASGADERLAIARLHLAAARLALRDEAAARAALAAALDTAATRDGVSLLHLDTRHLPELWPLLDRLDHPSAPALRALAATGALQDEIRSTRAGDDDVAAARGEMRVFALGEAHVLVGGQRVAHWRTPQARELLIFLLDTGQPVRKDAIVNAFWPEKTTDAADNAFRQVRFRLKQALGRECLVQERGRWRLDGEYAYDVRMYEQLVAEGTRLATGGTLGAAADTLRRAIACYGGDFFDDCYSDWAILRRDELRRGYLTALELLGDTETRLGRDEEAVQRFHRILALDATHERSHRALMLRHQRRGELAQAVQQFARCCNALKRDLNAAPSDETIQLYHAIRTRLDAPSPAPSAEGMPVFARR